jgi:hypothetical protein
MVLVIAASQKYMFALMPDFTGSKCQAHPDEYAVVLMRQH